MGFCILVSFFRLQLTVSAVLSIGEGRVAQLFLELDDILDILLLDGLEVSLGGFAVLEGSLGVEKLVSTKEGAEMLDAERGVAVERHGQVFCVLLSMP